MVLREIDFKLKIYQAENHAQKKKWLTLMLEAQAEADVADAEAAELEELEAKQREIEEAQKNQQ